MKDYFKIEKHYNDEQYIIGINHEKLPLDNTSGSYGLLFCRILGISYPDWVRLCRDVFDAEIMGKGCKYISIRFNKITKELEQLVELLNTQTELLLQKKKDFMEGIEKNA